MAEQPTRILLIRHGMNDYVKNRRLAGRTPGVHLNVEGRAQAAALAERLGGETIAALYASPLERAVETAEPLAARLGLAVRPHEGLLETDCGEWTGREIAELTQGDLWRQVQACPSLFTFPGGERISDCQARIVSAVRGLAEDHAGAKVAAVLHSDPIKLAVAFFTGMPLDHFQRLAIEPASITELEFTAARPRLLRLNDCGHLALLPIPDTM